MSWTNKEFSPEVAQRLAVMAREMRQLVWGGEGVPEWGTLFAEIEAQGMSIGGELARLMMEQAVEEQAQEKPPEASLSSQGESAALIRSDPVSLQTPAGMVHWDQPQARLAKQRRDFFPSDQSAGD